MLAGSTTWLEFPRDEPFYSFCCRYNQMAVKAALGRNAACVAHVTNNVLAAQQNQGEVEAHRHRHPGLD